MIRRPPRSTLSSSSAASDVYKRQTGFVASYLTRLADDGANRDCPLAHHSDDPAAGVHAALGGREQLCRAGPGGDVERDQRPVAVAAQGGEDLVEHRVRALVA